MFDITDRKVRRDQLLEAEERFRSLVEQIPAITYVEDRGLGSRPLHQPADREGPRLHPRANGYAIRRLWERSLHPEDRARVLAENAADTGDRASFSYRALSSDGRVVWLQNYLGADPGRRRRTQVLARGPVRHHRAQGGGAARLRGRGDLPDPRRAAPRGRLPGRRRRPQHGDLHQPAVREDVRLPARGSPARPRVLGHAPSPRRPRGRVLELSRSHERDGRAVLGRVPVPGSRRPLGMGPRRGGADPATSRAVPRTGRASCSTSPSASSSRRRSRAATPSSRRSDSPPSGS